ncbi:hypothetical protein JQC72_01945 [Polycladomyces sp. WAk]|uniref:Uncharacterized protein n=1 Tax=Polycladomyces zharkentensis TaxID=2807616 RepID=A0ABS2WFH1_9BACL|nr:hypothetical protein [Polycladomyces sp. WAk]MBN2908282.1 hypothetical protein [Polycladomyces sp. WAk]
MNPDKVLYMDLARTINQTLGRKAIHPERIRQAVEEAKRIKRYGGTAELIHYATHLYETWFTPEEVEMLKRSPRKKELSYRMIDLLILEKVLTPAQGMMLKRMV